MQEKMFEDIFYERPDYEEYAQYIEKCALEIRKAATMEDLCRSLESFFDYRSRVETMEMVAFIRSYHDCTDEFYQQEMQYTQSRAAMTDVSPVCDALKARTAAKLTTDLAGGFC